MAPGSGAGTGIDASGEQGTLHRHEAMLVVANGLLHLGHIDSRCGDGEQDVRVGAELLDDLDANVESRQGRIGDSRIFK